VYLEAKRALDRGIAAKPSDNAVAHEAGGRLRFLGIFWIIYAILCLIMAIGLFLYTGTATVMFGALLTRAPNPFTLMSVFHFMYAALIVLSVLCGLFGFLAGLALLAGQRSGRTLALIAAFLALSNLPLGTALGIYTLLVFLPPTARYDGHS
jgi:hypothetical protein